MRDKAAVPCANVSFRYVGQPDHHCHRGKGQLRALAVDALALIPQL